VQASVLTIAERHDDYAKEIYKKLRESDIRVEIVLENEKIGYKIREATVRKIPYLVIIGDKEIAENKITVRKRNGENIGPFTIEEFIGIIKKEIDSRQ
jgi:threonyl-tRNA synthetase